MEHSKLQATILVNHLLFEEVEGSPLAVHHEDKKSLTDTRVPSGLLIP
jgi:hypothetical protein